MKTIASFLMIQLFVIQQSFSQVTFYQEYGGNDYDQLWDMVNTFDGGYAFIGGTQSFNLNVSHMYFIKTDYSGNILSTKTYGGIYPTICSAIYQTSDSGFILVGTYNFLSPAEMLLIKTDRNGDAIWTKSIAGTGDNFGYQILETPDSGFVVLGEIEYAGNFYSEVLKISSTGNLIWNKTFGNAFGIATSIQFTKDSCFIIGGNTSGSVDADMTLSKLDINGNLLWSKRYESLGNDHCNYLEATSDSGFLITGVKLIQQVVGPTVGYVLKTDNAGNFQWSKTIQKQDIIELFSSTETSNGSYMVTGYFTDTIAGENPICLFNFNQTGDTIFTKAFGYGAQDGSGCATSIIKTSDGGLVLGGYGPLQQPGAVDCFLIKTDSSFNNNCNDSYPSFTLNTPVIQQISFTDSSFAVPLLNSIIPILQGNGGESSIHCLSLSTGQAKDEILLSIFPNPASESLKINGDVPFITNEPVIIQITNMIGQAMIIEDVAWRSDLPINVSSLPDGAYSLIVQSSKFMLHQKFIKTKN